MIQFSDKTSGYLVLDIETIPNQHIPPPTFNADDVRLGNLRDASKIAAKIAEARADWESGITKRMSLEGELCEVLSIGWMLVSESGEIEDSGTAYYNTDDTAPCRQFVELYSIGRRIVTWNGKRFDLPVLFKRCLQHGIAPFNAITLADLCNPYRHDRHADIMLLYNAGEMGHLVKACEFLKIPAKQGLDGSQIYDAYKAGRHAEIRAYNLQDCQATLEVAKRIGVIPS